VKRIHVYKGTKRSIVASVLNGAYTIEHAAFIVQVQPATIKRWLKQFGPDALRDAAIEEGTSTIVYNAECVSCGQICTLVNNGICEGCAIAAMYPHEEF
jgi:hypothetical protein